MNDYEIGVLKVKSIKFSKNSFNSFFYINKFDLPSKGTAGSGQIVALQIRYGNQLQESYFTTLGPFLAQIPRSYVGASPVVIQRLGLKENDEIFVSLCHANSLSVISVRPKCNDDYNVLVNMQNLMENVMLNQVRVVAPNQPIPLKIGNIIVDLTVEKMKPNGECGRLEQYTEVVVLDVTEKDASDFTLATLSPSFSSSSLTDLVWKFIHWGALLWGESAGGGGNNENERNHRSSEEILAAAFKQKHQENLLYRVIPEKHSCSNCDVVLINSGFKTDVATPCKVTKMPERTVLFQSNSETFKKEDSHIHVLIRCQESSLKTNTPEIYMTKNLMKAIDLHLGSRVKIEEISDVPKNIIAVKEIVLGEIDEEDKNIRLWSSIEMIRDQVTKVIKCSTDFGYDSNALITGPSGCGKSFLLKAVSKICAINKLYNTIVNCKALRGKKVESLLKVLTAKWSECAYRDPSVLFLDDVDALMYLNEEEGAESGMSAAYCKRVASLLAELHESFRKTSKICVIATASSVASLGPTLATPRGPRLFHLVLDIPEMSFQERGEIFKRLGAGMSSKLLEKTHGYRVQDVEDLVSRARLRSLVADRHEMTEEDLEAALEDTVPMALQGVQLQTEIPYKWSDVGGMNEVKKILDEIFRWPSQFPDLFATCPLRLQTGALLYGPPGCGKTLIAGALASECGMNFRSVKGPELLSKYVGASEAGVRSLFERAKQARPCLLFFDELDSLAPRRGADSTGVTDRVVNQLLTELDGVEGRLGVWVLGATSRPDLIDPALLRPGRLDRIIYCPVPTQEERLQILKVLSTKLEVAEDVVLADLVGHTEGFTGADLTALLYNSQMKAIQEYCGDDENTQVVVSAKHVTAALQETKSSLSGAEKYKYEQMFQAAKESKKATVAFADQPQKITFA